MTRTILIHANCHNTTARGDFTFAANMAKELKQELIAQGINDINVILVSELGSLARFTNIYGNPIDGCIKVDGVIVGLSSLEEFDAVENSVIAYIDANRCKHPPAELVKRVLSPDSKILFIGNANQKSFADLFSKTMYLEHAKRQQPNLYEAFNEEDILIGSAGPGDDRLGFPTVTKIGDLPPLSADDQLKISTEAYGFMYLAVVDLPNDLKLIAQYLKLSNLFKYVLVGDFIDKKNYIQQTYEGDTSMVAIKPFPNIEFHQSLPNGLMRQMVAQAPVPLIVSTGITSTLEVMRDKKLPFYQYFDTNQEFVASYLIAVKSIVASDNCLIGALPDMIIELSNCLFAKKPLSRTNMARTNDLLKMYPVCTGLIEKNQTIIDQASGKITSRLLSFLNGARTTKDPIQLANVCISLRKSGEMGSPVYDQALRRAASWGRLFELKVLIKSMPKADRNKADSVKNNTALHWAVLAKNFDCARALVQAEANLDLTNNEGKTPLHIAVKKADRPMIKMLIEAGASLDIPDKSSNIPQDCAPDNGIILFINECHRNMQSANFHSINYRGN